jgi:MtfA peptidase
MGFLARWSAARRERLESRILRRRPIPDSLWIETLARYPFIARRDAHDLAALRRLATLFLARKEFTGAGGLIATDEIATAIAMQACLPILHLGLESYDSFIGIVVHPDEVIAQREHVDDAGVVHAYEETLSGEAMSGGPVMLNWHDAARSGGPDERAYNVVIHEFVHVLDMRDGFPDGVPLLASRAQRQHWQKVLEQEYEIFCRSLEHDDDPVIDPYGAEAPEEFFAVAAEAFFLTPQLLQQSQPELYRLLQGYFRQDPARAGLA